MTPKASRVLCSLENTNTTEGRAVSDALRGIASNGGHQDTDEHLITCAQEIVDSAKWFIREVSEPDT